MTRTLRRWGRRLLGVAERNRLDQDLDAELEAHLQFHVDDNLRRGIDPSEARRQALARLGGLAQLKERHRDQRGLPALEIVLKDLRFAWRLLRRRPGFSAVVLLTLAVGIGANTVMFSVVNTVLLRPLPYGDADRLVSVEPVDPARRPAFTAPPDYYAYRERTQTLDRIEAFYGAPYNLTGGGDPERVPTLIVSSGFFDTLGVTFAAGRGFRLHEEQQGSHRVAVLSHALWQRRFSADPAIVGTPITLNGEPFIVVGVLPAGFYYLGVNPLIFVPMSFRPGDALNSHSNHFLRLFGRTRAGVTHTQAAAELSAVAGAIDVEQSLNPGTTVEVMSLRDALVAATSAEPCSYSSERSGWSS